MFWHPMMRPGRSMPMQSPVPDKELVATYEAPFYVDPIISWRAWSVVAVESGLTLRSVTYNVLWPKRDQLKAICCSMSPTHVPSGHEAPHPGHACGIYSVKDMDDAKNWALHGTTTYRVIGEVKIWGRVFQYERGYICEFAYPASIYVTTDLSHWQDKSGYPEAEPEDIAYDLAQAYEVPVTLGWPE